jgi:hypothetical protein
VTLTIGTNRLVYSLSYCRNTSPVAIGLDSLALYTTLFIPQLNQTTQNLALLISYGTVTSDTDTLRELGLLLVILLGLTLALGNRETRSGILNKYLKETLRRIRGVPRRFLRLLTT